MTNSKDKSRQLLEGINVLDFGWALVGSITGEQLANHGARVVRVESTTRLDATRTAKLFSTSTSNNPDDRPWYAVLNTSKLSMTLDLKNPFARPVIEKLVRWADVVNANFTPGTLEKLGFGYNYMKSINPEIVMAEASVYGQTGSLANQWGVDGTGAALSGYLDLTGWPDRGPVCPNVPYGDVVLPFFIASAIIAALDYRNRTGKGQYIDASMFEVCVHQITQDLLDWQINQNLKVRNGNRVPNAAPHGVFPCLGDDRWCAIAVFSDEEWQAFCNVIGNPDWTREARFSSLNLRKKNEDELEELVAQWTRTLSAENVMKMMQAAGVCAGVVQNAQDMVEHDPQLKEREFLTYLKHPVLGTFGHPTPPYKLLKTKYTVKTAPCLGEHTEYVCTRLLNMSDEEFVDLLNKNVFK